MIKHLPRIDKWIGQRFSEVKHFVGDLYCFHKRTIISQTNSSHIRLFCQALWPKINFQELKADGRQTVTNQ